MEEPVVIPHKGKQMFGILHTPDDKNAKAIIINIHGFVGNKIAPHRMLVKVARRLVNNGFAVLRFDFLGAGDSEGDYEDMTISSEIEEALTAIEWVKNRPEFKRKKRALLGYSMGGCIAACCSNRARDIETTVLWSAISNPFWNFSYLIGEDFKKGLRGEEISFEGNVLGKEFFKELKDLDPVEELGKFNRPVLIVQAEEDEQVQPLNALAYKDVFKHNSSKVYYIKDAGHLYDLPRQEEELLELTVEWFKKYLA